MDRAESPAPAPSSTGLIGHARSVYDRQLDDAQRRVTRILLVLLAICLLMLVSSGMWQFFRHAPDPAWWASTAID